MADFLTSSWFAELTARAAELRPPAALELSIEQRIDDEPQECWQVRIAGGGVEIVRSPVKEADVHIITDRATATGIQAGEISAQRAFLDGRLRIGGDVQALMNHRDALAELGLGLV